MYKTIVIIYLCANSTINFIKLYPHKIKHAIRITSAINITVTKDPENKPDNVFPIDIPNTVTLHGSSSIALSYARIPQSSTKSPKYMTNARTHAQNAVLISNVRKELLTSVPIVLYAYVVNNL